MATDLFSLPLGVLHRICYFLPSSSSVTYFLENDLDHRAPPLTQELPILDLGSLSRFSRSSRALHILTTPFLYSTAAQDQIQDYAVETHLHHAAAVGNDRAIRAILHHRPNAIRRLLEADSNQCYRAYRRPIFCAAAGGHLSTIQLLHSLGDDPKESDANIFGVGALNYAALNGHLEACQLILKLVSGYNPGYNTPDFQHTPLFWAAMNGHLDIVDYFIASGADPNSETPDGENMLHWLAKQYSTFLHDMTRPYGSPEGSYEAAKLLIHRGTNPELSFQPDEEKPEEYETPLSLALRHGNIPVARALLIDGRVNPNRALADEDPNGDRALHYLARHPPADIAHYRNEWIYVGSFVLLMKFGGAKLEMLNRRGYTPFLVAVRELNPVAVRVLLENGANPDARTRKGKPALQVLIEGWAAAKDGRSQDPMGEALHPDLMTEQQKEDMRKREEAATENALKVFGELVQVLEAGAVNRNLGKWGTPLLVAVKKEAVWAVSLLPCFLHLFFCPVVLRCSSRHSRN